jgi:hypothetical protein
VNEYGTSGEEPPVSDLAIANGTTTTTVADASVADVSNGTTEEENSYCDDEQIATTSGERDGLMDTETKKDK